MSSYDPQNIFAKILRGEIPCIKLHEDEHTLAFMDIMPQTEGHALVIPKEPAVTLFELSDAAAERSAAACAVQLNPEPIAEYLRSNITLMKWMIANGYQDKRTLERRIKAMEAWIADPKLLKGDADAEYAAVIDYQDGREPGRHRLRCPRCGANVMADHGGLSVRCSFCAWRGHMPAPHGATEEG